MGGSGWLIRGLGSHLQREPSRWFASCPVRGPWDVQQFLSPAMCQPEMNMLFTTAPGGRTHLEWYLAWMHEVRPFRSSAGPRRPVTIRRYKLS